MTQDESGVPKGQTLLFSNGIEIPCAQIVCIESNQQQIMFPGSDGELSHLLGGRPSNLLIRLRDDSTVDINAGKTRLRISLPLGNGSLVHDEAGDGIAARSDSDGATSSGRR